MQSLLYMQLKVLDGQGDGWGVQDFQLFEILLNQPVEVKKGRELILDVYDKNIMLCKADG